MKKKKNENVKLQKCPILDVSIFLPMFVPLVGVFFVCPFISLFLSFIFSNFPKNEGVL